MNYSLFGIGRKVTGRTPFPCPRHAVFDKFLADMYTGWYPWCPVATDTVVLSLPATIGISMEPCVDRSCEIVSYEHDTKC